MSARMLAAFFLIIGLNLVFISTSFFLAYQNSRNHWNSKVEREAAMALDILFTSLSEKNDFSLIPEQCLQNLYQAQQKLISIAQLTVYSPEGDVVCTWENSSLDHYVPVQTEFTSSVPYYIKDQLAGYYTLIPSQFRFFEENRQFISRIIHNALGGMIFSFFVSLWLAFKLAGHFAREARDTARNLMNLSEGFRNFETTATSTAEIQAINEAALLLQKRMITEESRRNSWYENITHDLRTPITAMKSQFIACRDGILPMTAERWETILSELAGMELMIRDFTLLSRLETGDYKLNKQFISTGAIKEHLMVSLSGAASEKNIHMIWEFADFSFLCDFSMITTACSHLIRNAIQHSMEGSTITIQMGVLDRKGYFRVINQGQLDPVHLERIFDPLYKSDFSRKMKGSGLGLTISRKISEILGAQLIVENLNDNRISFELMLTACSSTLNV